MHLVIYVEEGCFGCAHARQIAGEIKMQHASLDVSVEELSGVSNLPEEVVAVPAYVLDGHLVSLGNPSLSDITALIKQGVGEEVRSDCAEKT